MQECRDLSKQLGTELACGGCLLNDIDAARGSEEGQGEKGTGRMQGGDFSVVRLATRQRKSTLAFPTCYKYQGLEHHSRDKTTRLDMKTEATREGRNLTALAPSAQTPSEDKTQGAACPSASSKCH